MLRNVAGFGVKLGLAWELIGKLGGRRAPLWPRATGQAVLLGGLKGSEFKVGEIVKVRL